MVKNIFSIEDCVGKDGEIFEEIIRTSDILIERIISTGQSTPVGEWYDQPKDEWVILLSGTAIIRFETGEQVTLVAGDYLLIPSHCRHRVEETSRVPPCLWIAFHGIFTTPYNQDIKTDNY